MVDESLSDGDFNDTLRNIMIFRDQEHHRKRIRLDRVDYARPGLVVSLTITTFDRRKVFTDYRCGQGCIDVLARVTDDHEMGVIAYCLMPDHLHLLIENPSGADLFTVMRQFKSWTTRVAWSHGWHGKLWQRSYYDHVLREDEDVADYIRYVLGNPVNAGLVETWRAYRWTGSFLYDFDDAGDWPLS